MNRIKSIIVALLILSLVTVTVNAGNVQLTGVTNTYQTLVEETANITSPSGGEKFMNNNVNVSYTSTGSGLKYKVNDGTVQDLPVSLISVNTAAEGSYTVTILKSDGTTILDSVSFDIDHTAPGDVTSVTSTSTETSITWNWTNPGDTDLDKVHVEVKKTSDNSVIVPDTTIGTLTTYTASGLLSGTSYTITIKTEDNAILQT